MQEETLRKIERLEREISELKRTTGNPKSSPTSEPEKKWN